MPLNIDHTQKNTTDSFGIKPSDVVEKIMQPYVQTAMTQGMTQATEELFNNFAKAEGEEKHLFFQMIGFLVHLGVREFGEVSAKAMIAAISSSPEEMMEKIKEAQNG